MVNRRQASPGCTAIIGAFFLVIASVFLGMGAITAYKAGYAQRNYRPVTGQVEQSYMTTSRGSKGGTSYIRHIRYSYPCGRDQCEGTTIGVTSFQSTNLGWQATQDWLGLGFLVARVANRRNSLTFVR